MDKIDTKKETALDKKEKEKESVGTILYTEKEIQKRAREIGRQITMDYDGEELIVICTLKGSLIWMSDLIKNIALDINIDFMVASSYGSSTTSSGVVKIKLDPSTNMYNKHVLIVEDIIDSGTTLKFVLEKLKERGPKSVKVCTMLDKPSGRLNDIEADYTGFTVEDLFIVGYGLDYDQKYRNLPYISYLKGDE